MSILDAVKIIKKHGSPGGLPVVTAYVDENASGEYSEKYLHTIILDSACTVIIINESSTAFTRTTFAKWLYDNNYRSSGTAYNVSGTSIAENIEGNIVFDTMLGMYSDNETAIKISAARKTLSYDKGAGKLVVTSGSPAITVSTFSDNVKII